REQLLPVDSREVERDCALVAVHRLPGKAALNSRKVVKERLEPAARRARGWLDYDDICAERGQVAAREHGLGRGNLQHAHVLKHRYASSCCHWPRRGSASGWRAARGTPHRDRRRTRRLDAGW